MQLIYPLTQPLRGQASNKWHRALTSGCFASAHRAWEPGLPAIERKALLHQSPQCIGHTEADGFTAGSRQIKCQQVGLVRDAANGVDDRRDLL
ncbi:hypothetical protein [Pseudomonas huanghezhanensis]|uniref:hypothetical protein n=1 Tax=Pseudomonas huanghezhanensis TaxID=3002903 RepID=UPI002285C349|nr:hypothetical protein [Pseudomonas sp. BSw22131]